MLQSQVEFRIQPSVSGEQGRVQNLEGEEEEETELVPKKKEKTKAQ